MNWFKARKSTDGIRERIEQDEFLFDCPIVAHGFAPHMRDYDVIFDFPQPVPGGGGTAYTEGRYCYRFTHCPEVQVTTVFESEGSWTWGDEFIDYDEWVRAGEPDGYLWATCYEDAYPGLSYVAASTRAAIWERRMGRRMHEVLLEANAHKIQLVCHDLTILKIANGDPVTGQLTFIDDPKLRSPYLTRPVTHHVRYLE